MPGTAVAVRDEDVAEARARQSIAIVHEKIANHALAHGHGARRLESEGAEVKRGGEHDVPVRALGHDALGDGLGEVAPGEGVHAHGQVRAMRLERAGGENDHRPLARQGVHGGARELFEEVDGQKLDPFVAARYSSFARSRRSMSRRRSARTRVAV